MKIAAMLLAGLLLAVRAHADHALVPTEVLFDEPHTYSYSLSPDFRYLAGYLKFEDSKRLLLIDTSSYQSYVLIDFRYIPHIQLRTLEWIDNDTLFLRYGDSGDSIAFVDFRFVNGAPEPRIRLTGARGVLVDPLQSIEDTVLFAREPLPGRTEYLLYTITVEQLEKSAFLSARRFSKSLPNAVMYRLDASSGYLLAATEEEELVHHWYLDESRTRWIKYFRHDPREYQFVPVGRLGPDSFAVLTNRDTDRMSLVEFDLSDQAIGDVLYQHPRYDLTDAEVGEDGVGVKSVSYVDHGRSVTEYFAEHDSRLSRSLQQAFPEKHAELMSRADSGTKKVLYVSASDDPGTYYVLDTKTRQAQILSSRYADVEEYELSKSEVFTVPTADGEPIEAILTRPKHPNGVLLVNPHGGPIGVRDYARYNPEVQFFANRGYSVLNVNFRGSSGFGKEFLDTGRGQFGKRIEEDISAVVAQVVATHEFRSLCAIGASYGGYSALMLAIRHPELYQCVVAMYGVFDLPFVFNTSNYTLLEERRRSIEAVIGENSVELKAVSPFYRAEDAHAPVLLIAGTEDTIADYEQTNRMKYRLQQLQKPVEYYYYAGTGHGHRTWRGERHQFALIDDFIRRTLELELPSAPNVAAVIGAEYSLIGEYYEDTTFIDGHMDMALRYYRKAAGLGDGPAMYRLASFHEEGIHAARDPDLAYDYLQRSSEHGHADASYRLGTLYRGDEAGDLSRDIDATRSFEFFRKAREQGHVLARFDVARALCSGAGVDQDLEECLFLLTFDADDERGADATARRSRRTAVLGELAWSLPPDSEASARLGEFVESSLDAYRSGIRLDVVGSGVVKDNGRISDGPIPAEKGKRFGIDYRVQIEGRQASDRSNVVVKARLTGPETDDGQGPIVEEFIHVGVEREKNRLFYEIVDDPGRVQGKWRLEIRTLDHELLAEELYQVGAASPGR